MTLASLSERGGLGEGSLLSLVAYTPQRPYIATIAEGCRFRELRGEPQVLLHDCAASAAVAGAALFLETPRGPVLLGIQLGTGLLDGKPVGAAAMLERTLDLETLAGRPTGP